MKTNLTKLIVPAMIIAFFAALTAQLAYGAQATDAVTASADSQAKRIINEPLVKSFISIIEAKFDVSCELPKVEKSDEVIHWMCLNNMSCSYKMPVSCYQKNAARTEKIQLTFSGFDSQGQNELQDVQIKHL